MNGGEGCQGMQSGENYLQLIRSFPAPTPRQIAMFASYTASARRWEIVLPYSGKVPFCLFLDPHGGEFMVWELNGQKMFRPIEKPAGGFSKLRTADYRQKFSLWNYAANLETVLLSHESEGRLEKSEIILHIADMNGWEFESSELNPHVGRVGLNALICPLAAKYLAEMDGQVFESSELNPRVGPAGLSTLIRSLAIGFWKNQLTHKRKKQEPFSVLDFLKRCEESSPQTGEPQMLPLQLADVIESQNWDVYGDVWRKEDFFEKLLDDSDIPVNVREELFPLLLEYAECKRTKDVVREFYKGVDFTAVDTFLSLVVREQLRQLRAIKNAMNRVVRSIYGEVKN
jgi:hypothetical protein